MKKLFGDKLEKNFVENINAIRNSTFVAVASFILIMIFFGGYNYLNSRNMPKSVVFSWYADYKSDNYFDSITVSKYSENLGVRGIVTDVEPLNHKTYSDGEKMQILHMLSDFFAECKKVVSEYNLELINCMPTWYDTISENYCSRIIEAGDGTVLMNYTRQNMIDSISYEVGIANKYGKKIISAVELDKLDMEPKEALKLSFYGESVSDMDKEVYRVFKKYHEAYAGFHQMRTLLEIAN